MTQQFGYAVDRRYLPLLLPFRFRRDRDGVTLSDDSFEATFGFFRVTTARDNVTGAHITRSYRWWTARGRQQLDWRRELLGKGQLSYPAPLWAPQPSGRSRGAQRIKRRSG
jgi:hypothetical protein